MDELTSTVDQLTMLLRNVQQRAARDHPSHSKSHSMIKGGTSVSKRRQSSKDYRESINSSQHEEDKTFLEKSVSSEDQQRNVEMIL